MEGVVSQVGLASGGVSVPSSLTRLAFRQRLPCCSEQDTGKGSPQLLSFGAAMPCRTRVWVRWRRSR